MRKIILLVVGVAALFLAVNLARGPVSVETGLRIDEDTNQAESVSVECGNTFEILFQNEFAPGVPGSNTRNECIKKARTQALEIAGLVVLGVAAIAFGIKAPRRKSLKSNARPLPKLDRAEP